MCLFGWYVCAFVFYCIGLGFRGTGGGFGDFKVYNFDFIVEGNYDVLGWDVLVDDVEVFVFGGFVVCVV